MDIFLTKTHGFATGGLYSPFIRHVRHVLLWMCGFYLTSFGLFNRNTPHCNDNAWNSQDNFLYNSDWICLKEESHIHLGCLEGE